MKTFISLIALLFVVGCGTTSPPTKTEQHFFDIQTNLYPHLIVVTNVVTNAGPAVTNYTTITNLVPFYVYTPNTNAQAITETAGAVGNLFGVGGIVTTIIGGFWGLWAQIRSRRNGILAATLMQAIETGSEVLKSTPQGQALDAQWKSWMQANQKETGVLIQVLDMLNKVVDNESAKDAAAKLIALMKERQPPTA